MGLLQKEEKVEVTGKCNATTAPHGNRDAPNRHANGEDFQGEKDGAAQDDHKGRDAHRSYLQIYITGIEKIFWGK